MEAIIRSDNGSLLQRFLSETGEIRVIDGALVTEEESIPAISFSIQGRALRCASTLVQIGVTASQVECAEIMRIAFINDDIEAMNQFLKKVDKNTLTKYLFEVFFILKHLKTNKKNTEQNCILSSSGPGPRSGQGPRSGRQVQVRSRD